MTIKTTFNYRRSLGILRARTRLANKLGQTKKVQYRRYRTPKHLVVAVDENATIAGAALQRLTVLADKLTFDLGVLRLYFVL